jgi:hypothetical protein
MKRLNNIRILSDLEVRGDTLRDVHARAGYYLCTAATPEHAKLFAQSGKMASLCKRAAEGDTPSREEFEEVVQPLLALFKVAA